MGRIRRKPRVLSGQIVQKHPVWATSDHTPISSTKGLITFNTHAISNLTGDAPPPQKPDLNPEQLQRIADLKAYPAKKQKVARLLIESDLPEEAEPHQRAAEKALAEAEKIEDYGA